MAWYAETKRFDGKIVPSLHQDYPADRNTDGQRFEYGIRTEIRPADEEKTLDELASIYGSGVQRSNTEADS